MLDIKFIRENKELVSHDAKVKRIKFNVDELIEIDDMRRDLQKKFDELRNEQNIASEKIVSASQAEKDEILSKIQGVKKSLKQIEDQLKNVMLEWQKMMVSVPNIPDISVPEGESEVAIGCRRGGTARAARVQFDFRARGDSFRKLGEREG